MVREGDTRACSTEDELGLITRAWLSLKLASWRHSIRYRTGYGARLSGLPHNLLCPTHEQIVPSGGWLADVVPLVSDAVAVWDVFVLSAIFVASWVVLRVSDSLTSLILGLGFDLTIPLQHYCGTSYRFPADCSEPQANQATSGTSRRVLADSHIRNRRRSHVLLSDTS